MKCRFCGYENKPGVKFCASCKTPIVYPLGYQPEDEATKAAADAPKERAMPTAEEGKERAERTHRRQEASVVEKSETKRAKGEEKKKGRISPVFLVVVLVLLIFVLYKLMR